MSCKFKARLQKSASLQHTVSAKRHAHSVNFVSVTLVVTWLAQVDLSIISVKVVPRLGFTSFVSSAFHVDHSHTIGVRVPMVALNSFPSETDTTPSSVPDKRADGKTFRVSGATNIRKFGSILARFAQNGSLGTFHAEGKGASASAIAIKSVVVANSFLPATISSPEAVGPQQIIILPSTVSRMQNGTEARIRKFQFQLAVVRSMPIAEAAEETLKVSKITHFGGLAKAMLRRIETDGEAVLTSVGDQALSNLLVATMIAQTIIDKKQQLIDENEDAGRLVLLPAWYNSTGGTRKQKGMQLCCFKI